MQIPEKKRAVGSANDPHQSKEKSLFFSTNNRPGAAYSFSREKVILHLALAKLHNNLSNGAYLTNSLVETSQCPARGDFHPHSALNAPSVQRSVPFDLHYSALNVLYSLLFQKSILFRIPFMNLVFIHKCFSQSIDIPNDSLLCCKIYDIAEDHLKLH